MVLNGNLSMTYDAWIMGAAVAGIVAYLVVKKIKDDQA